MKVILINWWMIWKRMMLSISTTKFLIAELAVADYNFHRWTSKPTEYYSVNSKPTCKPPELHTIMKKCNGTGMVLKICETKNNVWKRHILSIQNSIDNHIKTTRIKPNFASLNNDVLGQWLYSIKRQRKLSEGRGGFCFAKDFIWAEKLSIISSSDGKIEYFNQLFDMTKKTVLKGKCSLLGLSFLS